VQHECRGLSEADAPDVNPLLQRAAAALRERPVLFRYCAEEVAQARHTALFQRFIKVRRRAVGCLLGASLEQVSGFQHFLRSSGALFRGVGRGSAVWWEGWRVGPACHPGSHQGLAHAPYMVLSVPCWHFGKPHCG
jgi:hypothetical protein